MTTKLIKPPGHWTDHEDSMLRVLCRKQLPWNEIADRLNRLEKSVRIRAQVIKAG